LFYFNLFMARIDNIKKVLRGKYLVSFLLLFLLFLGLNIYFNDLYVTYEILFNLSYGIPFIFLNLAIGTLIGLNINLFFFKYNESKNLNKKGSGLSSLGIFLGFLGGGCPGCIAGIFPAFLGLFGISAGLGILPFNGFEIQIFSVGLLFLSVFILSKDSVCKI